MLPAAEDGESQPRSAIRRGRRICDPAAEPLGVVGGLAVIGRAHHNKRSLVRQPASVIIQGA
jgi:hypothetical protein